MKKCKACQKEIDKKATVCPYCRTKQVSKPVQIITGIIVIFVVLWVFGALFGGSKTSSSTQTSKSTQANENEKGGQQKDATPKVGEVTKLGDREFIVNSVRRSGAFNYNTPKAGKEFIIINVTIKNSGKDEVSYNPFDFKVQDANGAQESYTIAPLDDQLSSGTLAPGGKVTGSMPFEVPIGDKATLIFQPSFWSSQRVVVDLGDK